MALHQYIRPRSTTGAYGTLGSGGSGEMPDELLADLRRRLGVAAVVYALAYALGMVPVWVLGTVRPSEGWFASSEAFARWAHYTDRPPVGHAVSLLAVAGAVLFWWLLRSGRISDRKLLGAGLSFLVLGALGISVPEHWWPWFGELQYPRGISWVCWWIAVFPLIVPTHPRKILTASLLAAGTGPVGLALSVALGGVWPDETFTVLLFLPQLVAAAVSYLAARVIFEMGRRISKARQLGSYQLVELLGRGGMGEVWCAEHRLLARPAAVKLVRPERLGADGPNEANRALKRFEREAQATAALGSPHTVELYDFGITEDGTFYYVMELLDGLDLETLVARYGPMPAERVVNVLEQVCDSLAEAHDAGLVHRDVKPANIYLCRKGLRHDFTKVLDFGLVKSVADDAATETKLTAEGSIGGTPAYMAPELATGSADVDHRADLYSLGCVAYWMLTARLVFDQERPVRMVLDHIQTPPIPPSLRTELAIPRELEDIVMACLAKEPEQRPADAQTLLARLREVRLERPWTTQRAAQWWEAHRSGQIERPDEPDIAEAPTRSAIRPAFDTEPE